MNTTLSTLALTALLALQGCSTFENHHGINWNSANPDLTCPELTASQKDSGGRLLLQDGKIKKCQIRPFVSNMACQGLKDSDGTDVIICQNGEGSKIVFFFTDEGVLKSHKTF